MRLSSLFRESGLLTFTFQAVDKGQHLVDKSARKEHKAAAAVEKAQHNHQAAVASEASAEKSLNVSIL